MEYINKHISSFRVFAKDALEEEIAALREIENSLLISGKLARFKVFNTHLEQLQQTLNGKIQSITSNAEVSKDVKEMLEATLNATSAEYINEYMCSSFLKSDGQ